MIEKGLKMLKMLKNTANFGQKNGPLGMWVEKNNSTNFPILRQSAGKIILNFFVPILRCDDEKLL